MKLKRIYTLTRDAILGLTELPALHSLAQEATNRRVNEKAATYCNTEYDQDIANLTEERDELRKTVASLSGDLEIERAFNTDDRIAALEKERDGLKAQLDRHIEAERWHQVTAGEGELPPEDVEVIYRFSPRGPLCFDMPYPPPGTYEWCYVSSKDVPNG